MSAPPDPHGEPHRAHLAPAARADAVRYGAVMLRRFGWFYRVLGLGRRLGRMRFEDHSVDRVRAAAESGPIVYVLLSASGLDHLALNTVLNRRRLPLSVWANGVTSFWWQPLVDAWRDVWTRVTTRFSEGRPPEPVSSGWLARTVDAGAPVTVFLEDRETLGQRVRRVAPADPFDALLEAQARSDRPIQLLPVVVVWTRAPEGSSGVRGFLEGSGAESPGLGSRLQALVLGTDDAFVQVGEPVDLREFAERVDAPRRTRALRMLLRRWLRRESKVVRGPRLLPRTDMRRLVLDNPPMRELARQEADATGRSYEQVRRQMVKDFDTIAARFSWRIVRMLNVVLRPLWTRVFAGVDVRDEDLERIRSAMRHGTAVLVPSHKSHFDYLLLSWVLFQHDLIIPHVVAGVNLAIWPVSILLRGAGGFFIKRSFAGERIFPAVFSRYLRELVRHGYPVEFFIEGGRTRSGKLLTPRLGVLGMVLDAAAHRPSGTEVTLLPISLAYEQVAEEGVYARELGGEEKTPESMSQLVKARSVLSRRFGRVYLRVGEPVRCSEIVDPTDDAPAWEDRNRQAHKEALRPLGERLVHRIGRATVTLPTCLVALALLAHHRRGLRHEQLVARVDRFRAFLLREGAMEAASLERFSQARNEALDRFRRAGFIESLEHDGARVWAVSPDKRLELDFYKNQLLHFFATAGMAAAAVRALPPGPFSADDVRPGFVSLAWTLRREFVLDPDRSASEVLDDALAALLAHGALTRTDNGYAVADPERMGEIHGLVRSLLESYALVLRSVDRFRRMEKKEIVKALQGETQALLASGAVTRPESLSRVTLDNAIGAFAEERLLRADDRNRLEPDAPRVRATLEALSPMVD